MAKLALSDLVTISGNEGAAITVLNNNAALIEAAVENTLSRDGTAPNMMEADLDMNTNDILNVGDIDAATGTISVLNIDTINGGVGNFDQVDIQALFIDGKEFDADGALRNLRLRQLIDVNVDTVAGGDTIVYDAGTQMWIPGAGTPSAVAWGDITGTLSNQTDLQTALNAKAALVHTHVIADITDYVAYTTEDAQDATGAMVDGTLVYVDATPLLTRAALTGDISVPQASNVTTLATVNSNVGSFGSATQVMTQTVNAKGLTTAAANVSIAIPSTQITDFTEAAQDVIGALIVSSTSLTMTYNDAGNSMTVQRAALTGDIAAPLNSNATTLATVNANVGSFGSATQVGGFTVNGKGLVTAASNTSIAIPSTAVTDFTEAVQDVVGAFAVASTGMTVTYSDVGNTLTFATTITQYTDEMAQDTISTLLAAGTHTNITYTYNDAGNALSVAIDDVFAFNSGDIFTGAVGFPDGALGSPSIYRSGGSVTGIYFGAGAIHLTANGSTDVLFNASGISWSRNGAQSLDLASTSNTATLRVTSEVESTASVVGLSMQRSNAGAGLTTNGTQIGVMRGLGHNGVAYTTLGNNEFTLIETPSAAVGGAWTAMGTNFIVGLAPIGSTAISSVLTCEYDAGLKFRTNVFLDGNRLFQLRTSTIAGAFAGATGKLGYFTDLYGGVPVFYDGTKWRAFTSSSQATKTNTTAFSLTPKTDATNIKLTGVITAARNITVSATNAVAGDKFHITRDAASTGAFNWNIVNGGPGAGTLKGLAVTTWAEITFDGTDWYLSKAGSL